MKAAANVLFGRYKSEGKLPVDLSPEYLRGTGKISQSAKSIESHPHDYNLESVWAVVDSAMAEKIFPGAQITIIKAGNLIASRGFGFQTYDNMSPPISTESIYDVASLTKVLSTIPVTMKLIAQKKLVVTYYAGFDEGNQIFDGGGISLMFSMGEFQEVAL